MDEFKNCFVKIIVEEKRSYTKFEEFVERLYRTGIHDIKIVETLVDIDAVDDVDLDIKDTLTFFLFNSKWRLSVKLVRADLEAQ